MGSVDDLVATLLAEQWGRLLALLVARFGRLDVAEDALGEAFEAGLCTWPDGVPGNPPGWLLTVARRRALDRLRAEAVAARSVPALAVEARVGAEAQRVMADVARDGEVVVDERLRLVLLCAHPRLPREHAAALTLRLVLGVSTADVARLFLVPTPTMAARLTRARKRLAGARFDLPSGADLHDRLATVLDVAYLAFTAGYAPGSGAELLRADVAGEAVRLVRTVRAVLPDGVGSAASADVDALLALMLLHHSRRDARLDGGRLVLLPDQDRARWHHDEAREALALLTPLLDSPATPYLLQALVAAEHAIAPSPAATDWQRVVRWYDELVRLEPSPAAALARAVAVAERDGAAAGLQLADELVDDGVGHRLPATRAELLARLGRDEEARDAYDLALERCANEAESTHLAERRAALPRPRGG